MQTLNSQIAQIEREMEKDLAKITDSFFKKVDPASVRRRYEWVIEHNPGINPESIKEPLEYQKRAFEGNYEKFRLIAHHSHKTIGKGIILGLYAFVAYKVSQEISNEFLRNTVDIMAFVSGTIGGVLFLKGLDSLCATTRKVIKIINLYPSLTDKEKQLAYYVWQTDFPEKENPSRVQTA